MWRGIRGKALRCELLDPKISEHHRLIVKTTGDGMLVEFASVVGALGGRGAAGNARAEHWCRGSQRRKGRWIWSEALLV
jgi:class 3 adenylate cyclase